ncbi:MAG: YibE/F family protein [Patescibacteria group bacterium]
MKKLFALLLLSSAILPLWALSAQPNEQEHYLYGQVSSIIDTEYSIFQGREVEIQILEIKLPDGSFKRDVYNDYTPLEIGDKVYFSPAYNPETNTYDYFIKEVDRLGTMWFVFIIFVILYLGVAGKKGLRSLIALVVSIASVYFILLPALQAGYDPLYVGVGISALILGFAIFITHGLSIISLVSYIGSILAIMITLGFALISFTVGDISGTGSEYASTLGLLYGPTLDIKRLVLAGIIIGILGVLDDVAVMQAALVREFAIDMRESSAWQLFSRAMKVGREHAAALVNTLVLAYTAVALPIFLIVFAPLRQSTQGIQEVPLAMHLSNELFVIEFLRSIIGSFGLVLTVPIVTVLAVIFYRKYPPQGDTSAPHSHTHHS